MKKTIIIFLFASSWIITLRPNNTLISDTLRRYGIDSHIMKTREFKKPRRFNKSRIESRMRKNNRNNKNKG